MSLRLYSEHSLDISSEVPEDSSGSSLIMGQDEAVRPWMATHRRSWPIAADSRMTCFCWDLVRVR